MKFSLRYPMKMHRHSDQVLQPIVISDSINVVNHVPIRNWSVDLLPNYPMFEQDSVATAQPDVAVSITPSGSTPTFPGVASIALGILRMANPAAQSLRWLRAILARQTIRIGPIGMREPILPKPLLELSISPPSAFAVGFLGLLAARVFRETMSRHGSILIDHRC